MIDRKQILDFLMQQAAAQQTFVDLLLQSAPSDFGTLEFGAQQLQAATGQLIEQLSADAERQAPPDGGDAGRIGLGPQAASDLGQVYAPVQVRPYDEQVPSGRLFAVADLYYCYQHERLGVFRAVQKLQELFRAGVVKLEDGPGAVALYQFDLKKFLRYTRAQRLQAYRRVFGYTSAAPPAGARPNAPFHGLLHGFALQVAQLFRDRRIAETIRGASMTPDAAFGSVAAARRAGLDFRANLKQAAYGDVNVLAVELMQLLRQAFVILGAPDVMRQYGATDAWDALEEVLIRHLGEQPQTSQRSRLAITGRDLINWLAHPFVLATGRAQFEALAEPIAEAAEEWLTSARSVAGATPAAVAATAVRTGSNVVPLRRAAG